MDWEPILPGEYRLPAFVPHRPHPKQAVFLGLHHVREALYGGAAGGGKSDALIMDACQYWDVPGYSALIVRKTFPDLAQPGAIMDRAKAWFIPRGINWHEGQHIFTFPARGVSTDAANNGSGGRLKFGYLNNPNDRFSYQSAEYQFIGVDEGTQFEEAMYVYLGTRVRRPKDIGAGEALAQVPLRLRMASNPGNIGHEWVKARFIPYNNEQTGERTYPRDASGHVRAFVPARLADNPSLDAETYAENLMELDPVTRAQLLEGDWGVRPPGEMFDHRSWRYAYWDAVEGVWTDVEQTVRLTPKRWVRFWDLASTKKRPNTKRDPDWTVGALMARCENGDVIVRDVRRIQGTPVEVETLIIDTAKADRQQYGAKVVRIEQEPGSSGEFAIDRLTRNLMGFDADGVRPTGPKEERARPYATWVGKGRVWLPSGAPWVTEWVNEHNAFPNEGLHDDQVDAGSGGFEFLAETYVSGSATVNKAGGPANPYMAQRGAGSYGARRRTLLGGR